MDRTPWVKLCLAEFLGTYILVFAGCGAIAVNTIVDGAISHAGVALVWGLIVMSLIYAIGQVSGAHMNPAVTIAFWASRRFEMKKVLPYICVQLLGATAASATLFFLLGSALGKDPSGAVELGQTIVHPKISLIQACVLEGILTFILMYVILCVATGSKKTGILAGVAIGSIIGLEAMFAGPLTRASMNPARSIGPALFSGHINIVWLYIVGPIAGALLAIPAWKLSHGGEDDEVEAETPA